MMSRAALQLVLLVSCAHALVHVYELSLPSVEQEIADEYFQHDREAGKRMTGRLSNYWRLLWGLGALVAGWLVDRLGGRKMLAVYLLGCAATCVVAAISFSQPTLLAAMISMGALASIYHPAGLALISHNTSAANRPRALGLHGIFGSAGIGSAPMIAWLLVTVGDFSWRQYYWALAIPGAALGIVFVLRHRDRSVGSDGSDKSNAADGSDEPTKPIQILDDVDSADWWSYFPLTVLALMQGFVYSAMMSFLPRYLSGWDISWLSPSGGDPGKMLAAVVLLVGCLGQYLAGRFAKPDALERQLTYVTFANAPFLLWMALAGGWDRAVAAAMFAMVHFMHQPLYNSLIAKYTPRRHRSLCYGFSFAMGLGFGSFGARFAGNFQSDLVVYGALAIVAAGAGIVGILLCWLNRKSADQSFDGGDA